MFSQLYYGKDHDIEVKGIENVNGEPCYKLSVKKGDNTSTEFYSIKTNLLMRTVQSQGGATVSTDMGDYKAINGIMLPHTVTTSGMGPAPMSFKATRIKVNETLDTSLFEIK